MNKRMKETVRKLRKLGCTVTVRRNCHLHIRLPNGAQAFTSSTPSDVRTTKNLIAELRRKGLQGI